MTADRITFEGVIERQNRGRNTCTTLRLRADGMTALRAAGRSDDWARLTAGQQRSRMHQVHTAKRAETRANRVDRLIAAP